MRVLTLDRPNSSPHFIVDLDDHLWVCRMLETGELILVRIDDDHQVLPLDPGYLTQRYGVDKSGDVVGIARTYTVAELRVAVPRLAELFEIKLPAGELQVSGSLLAWGDKSNKRYFRFGRREVSLNQWWYQVGGHAPSTPVLHFHEFGGIVYPMASAVACLTRWADLIPEQARCFMKNHPATGYKDSVTAFLTDESVRFMWQRRYGEGFYV